MDEVVTLGLNEKEQKVDYPQQMIKGKAQRHLGGRTPPVPSLRSSSRWYCERSWWG